MRPYLHCRYQTAHPAGTRTPPARRPQRMERAALETRWLTLTRETLPALASPRGWPVSADHCFQRILLDHVCGGVWYDHVERPAYRHLTDAQLRQAVAAAESVMAGDADLSQLNRQSLDWRRTRKAVSR